MEGCIEAADQRAVVRCADRKSNRRISVETTASESPSQLEDRDFDPDLEDLRSVVLESPSDGSVIESSEEIMVEVLRSELSCFMKGTRNSPRQPSRLADRKSRKSLSDLPADQGEEQPPLRRTVSWGLINVCPYTPSPLSPLSPLSPRSPTSPSQPSPTDQGTLSSHRGRLMPYQRPFEIEEQETRAQQEEVESPSTMRQIERLRSKSEERRIRRSMTPRPMPDEPVTMCTINASTLFRRRGLDAQMFISA